MPKNWWFKFEYRVWQSDPHLSQCSLAARGFWLEMLCAMSAQGVSKISGTIEQIARLARCESAEVAKYALELKETKTADVTLGNGNVTLVSRRLAREVSDRERSRLRVQRHRGNADVTVQSKSKSKSKEKKEEPPTPLRPKTEAVEGAVSEPEKRAQPEPPPRPPHKPNPSELDTWLDAVASALGAVDRHSLPKVGKWTEVCKAAIRGNQHLPDLLDVVAAEIKRLGTEMQFFSPENCLQKLQVRRKHGNGKLPTAAEKHADADAERRAIVPPPGKGAL